jgi:peptidoglycan hydrolase CwlO-like protein
MALAREGIDLEDIKRDAKIEALLQHVISQDVEIAQLKDKQFEFHNEIESRDDTISKLEDDIQLLKKEKRWNMLWRNSLEEDIAKTQVFLAIVFLINIIFTYFMNR